MTGTLYLLPNTLGAMDLAAGCALAHVIPEEVQRTTARLEYFIAENAKTTRAFLKAVAQVHPLARPLQEIRISGLDVNTSPAALPVLLEPLLDGEDAGLISEAGVPAVADPGANLVRMAHEMNIRVRPLVGPSSLLLAVMAGGLNGQSFAFNGYLPTDAAQRQKRIRELEDRSRRDRQTQMFIETPYRNAALLEALANSCQPGTLVSLATDLTMAGESIRTQAAARWKQDIKDGRLPDFHRKPTVFSLLAQ